MRRSVLCLLLACATPAAADVLVATRTIRAQEILGPADVALRDGAVPGGLSDPAAAIGQEARVAIYAGRPVRTGDIGAPTVVERNQIVLLTYFTGTLEMTAEARALARGGVGDRIRVMNLSSRSNLFGEVQADGTVKVSQ